MNTYLNGLVYLPVFGLHSLTDTPEEVDQQLALDAVVDNDGGVGNVQHDETNDSDDDQYPPDYNV